MRFSPASKTGRDAADRAQKKAQVRKELAAQAGAAATQAAAEVRQAVNEVKSSVRAEWVDAREFSQKMREAVRAGVRCEDGKLVIGAHVSLPELPGLPHPTTLPVPPIADAATPTAAPDAADEDVAADEPGADREEELAVAIESDMTEQLYRYFDELVSDSTTTAPALAELRSRLAALPPGERREVAAEVARLEGVIDEDKTVTTEDPQSGRVAHRVLVAQVPPERIDRLIRTGQYRLHDTGGSRLSRTTVAFGTIGVLLAATIVLKSATRRHARGA